MMTAYFVQMERPRQIWRHLYTRLNHQINAMQTDKLVQFTVVLFPSLSKNGLLLHFHFKWPQQISSNIKKFYNLKKQLNLH